MDTNIDNLKRFLEQIKTISFFGRLFHWNIVKQRLIDSAGDLQKLITSNEYLKEQVDDLATLNSGQAKDIKLANDNAIKTEYLIEKLNGIVEGNKNRNIELEREVSSAKTIIESFEKNINSVQEDLRLVKLDLRSKDEELANVKQQNTKLIKEDEFRRQEHSNSVSSLNQIREQIQTDRTKELEERNRIELERIKKLKDTWASHQENVKNVIKAICSRHTIEYIDKVPFKGEPDNTIKICDEYIILDAKSPAGDDLSNFPIYLKEQTEKAKKYSKEEAVKKDIFFVVPSNTLEKLLQFVFRLADFNVYIVSIDSLEPVILSLQKLEDYEFAQQLSPEERENICRVLGKFAHLTKRRIQIDSFFIKQFMELAYKCENDLPPDILEKVVEFEKAEKLNPPTERRTKQINLKELERATSKLRDETSTRGIAMLEETISIELNKLPLYNNEQKQE